MSWLNSRIVLYWFGFIVVVGHISTHSYLIFYKSCTIRYHMHFSFPIHVPLIKHDINTQFLSWWGYCYFGHLFNFDFLCTTIGVLVDTTALLLLHFKSILSCPFITISNHTYHIITIHNSSLFIYIAIFSIPFYLFSFSYTSLLP